MINPLDFLTNMAWFWLVISAVLILIHIFTGDNKTGKTIMLLLIMTLLVGSIFFLLIA